MSFKKLIFLGIAFGVNALSNASPWGFRSGSVFDERSFLVDAAHCNQQPVGSMSDRETIQWNVLQGVCRTIAMIHHHRDAISSMREDQPHSSRDAERMVEQDRSAAYSYLFRATEQNIVRNEQTTIWHEKTWSPHECRPWSFVADRDTDTTALFGQAMAWVMAQPARSSASWHNWTDAGQLLAQAQCPSSSTRYGINEAAIASVYAFQPDLMTNTDAMGVSTVQSPNNSVEGMFRAAELKGDAEHVRAAYALHAFYEYETQHHDLLRLTLARAQGAMTDAISTKDTHALLLDSMGRSLLTAMMEEQQAENDQTPYDSGERSSVGE